MKLETISWPVFQLKNEKPLYYNKVYAYPDIKINLDDGDLTHNILIIDDKNIVGNSLGERRLKLLSNNVKLYKLTKAIYMLGDLIRLTKGTKSWSIDSSGTVFNYIKTVRAPLTCHKIKKSLRVPTGGHVLELEGISERFKIMNELADCKYAGVITINRHRILYGLYNEIFKRSHRLV